MSGHILYGLNKMKQYGHNDHDYIEKEGKECVLSISDSCKNKEIHDKNNN